MVRKVFLLCIYLPIMLYIKLGICLSNYSYELIRKKCFVSSNRALKNKKIYNDKYGFLKLEIKCRGGKKLTRGYFLNNNIVKNNIEKKRKIIIANWKCYLPKDEAYKLINYVTKINLSNNIDLVIAPNLLYIPYIQEMIKENKSKIHTCSQDASVVNGLGPYTGETTASLIYDFGNTYTIIGHNERKKGFYNNAESMEQTILKACNAIQSNLKTILCVGDGYDNPDSQFSFEKTRELIFKIKEKIPYNDMENIIIAFEPSFAIGTGNSISSKNLNDICLGIKKILVDKLGKNISDKISIVYGGSINKSNVKKYLDKTIVDGLLVGRGSLDEGFFDTIKCI